MQTAWKCIQMPDLGSVTAVLHQTPTTDASGDDTAVGGHIDNIKVEPSASGASSTNIADAIDVLNAPGTPNVGTVYSSLTSIINRLHESSSNEQHLIQLIIDCFQNNVGDCLTVTV